MFNWLTEGIESGLNVAEDLISFEEPSKKDIARMLSAGFSAGLIVATLGVSIDIVHEIAEEMNDQ